MVDNPIWLAPEILMNKSYGRPSDIYAVGMIAWELLERAQPFAHTRFIFIINNLPFIFTLEECGRTLRTSCSQVNGRRS